MDSSCELSSLWRPAYCQSGLSAELSSLHYSYSRRHMTSYANQSELPKQPTPPGTFHLSGTSSLSSTGEKCGQDRKNRTENSQVQQQQGEAGSCYHGDGMIGGTDPIIAGERRSQNNQNLNGTHSNSLPVSSEMDNYNERNVRKSQECGLDFLPENRNSLISLAEATANFHHGHYWDIELEITGQNQKDPEIEGFNGEECGEEDPWLISQALEGSTQNPMCSTFISTVSFMSDVSENHPSPKPDVSYISSSGSVKTAEISSRYYSVGSINGCADWVEFRKEVGKLPYYHSSEEDDMVKTPYYHSPEMNDFSTSPQHHSPQEIQSAKIPNYHSPEDNNSPHCQTKYFSLGKLSQNARESRKSLFSIRHRDSRRSKQQNASLSSIASEENSYHMTLESMEGDKMVRRDSETVECTLGNPRMHHSCHNKTEMKPHRNTANTEKYQGIYKKRSVSKQSSEGMKISNSKISKSLNRVPAYNVWVMNREPGYRSCDIDSDSESFTQGPLCDLGVCGRPQRSVKRRLVSKLRAIGNEIKQKLGNGIPVKTVIVL